MGQHFRFRCESCGYEALVSGGDDFGKICTTTTIFCLDCKALYDVVTSDIRSAPAGSKAKFALECPKKAEHRCRKWGQARKCPRCKGKMQVGDAEVLWD